MGRPDEDDGASLHHPLVTGWHAGLVAGLVVGLLVFYMVPAEMTHDAPKHTVSDDEWSLLPSGEERTVTRSWDISHWDIPSGSMVIPRVGYALQGPEESGTFAKLGVIVTSGTSEVVITDLTADAVGKVHVSRTSGGFVTEGKISEISLRITHESTGSGARAAITDFEVYVLRPDMDRDGLPQDVQLVEGLHSGIPVAFLGAVGAVSVHRFSRWEWHRGEDAEE